MPKKPSVEGEVGSQIKEVRGNPIGNPEVLILYDSGPLLLAW